jgi:hypothetical protein
MVVSRKRRRPRMLVSKSPPVFCRPRPAHRHTAMFCLDVGNLGPRMSPSGRRQLFVESAESAQNQPFAVAATISGAAAVSQAHGAARPRLAC